MTHKTLGTDSRPVTTLPIDIDEVKWGAAMMRLRMVTMRNEMEIAALDACDKDDPRRELLEDLVEDSTDQLSDAEDVLIKMPAPNKSALLWKIERLWINTTMCWSNDHVGQTVCDIQRMLGDA